MSDKRISDFAPLVAASITPALAQIPLVQGGVNYSPYLAEIAKAANTVANGGTGATSLTGYVKGSGTSPLTAVATIPTSDVLFTQSGAGAVAYALSTKLSYYVNLIDFGADPTGVADSTTAFNNAMATGKAVYAPKGTYLLNSANITDFTSNNTVLFGDGKGTKFVTTDTTGDIFVLGDGSAEISGCFFYNFSVWSTGLRTSGHAFFCQKTTDSIWYNVYLGSADDYSADGHRLNDGIYFDRFSQNYYFGGEIWPDGDAIKCRGNADQSYGAELYFSGNLRIGQATGKAIHVGGASGGIYIDRVDASNCRYGLYVDSTLQAGVTNREVFTSPLFTIDNCPGYGIYIGDTGLAILEVNGTWVSGCGIAGSEAAIHVAANSGVSAKWSELRLQSSVYDGMNLLSGIHNISGGYCRSNGSGASGGHGIILGSNTISGANIIGMIIHDNGDGSRGYGIVNTAGADNLVVSLNNLFSNGQGATTGTFTGGNRIFTNNAGTETGVNAAWVTYTPTVTAPVGTITTVSATGRYRKIDRTVDIELTITITTNGTGSVRVDATLPSGITCAANAILAGRENAATGNMLQALVPTSGTSMAITKYDNTYPGADGYVLIVSGTFESTS